MALTIGVVDQLQKFRVQVALTISTVHRLQKVEVPVA